MLGDLPYAPDSGFDGLYGLRITALADDEVRGEVPVTDALKQPAGLVHGGVFAAIAESLASIGTLSVVVRDGDQAMGLSNATSFMRPVTAGTIHACARLLHRGRSTWVWDVEIRDDAGLLCAITRMTVAVRPARR